MNVPYRAGRVVGGCGDAVLCDMILEGGKRGKRGRKKREGKKKKQSPSNFQTTAKNKAKALIWGGAGSGESTQR